MLVSTLLNEDIFLTMACYVWPGDSEALQDSVPQLASMLDYLDSLAARLTPQQLQQLLTNLRSLDPQGSADMSS